ncbi:small GTPase superfamily, Rho type, partial [Kipferlia bialata]
LFEVKVWDTAGSEHFNALSPIYYRNACCALVVFDITSRAKYEEAINQWRQQVMDAAPDCQIILVGNKSDLVSPSRPECVAESEIEALIERWGGEHRTLYIKTSALTGDNVKKVFETAALAAAKVKQIIDPSECIDPGAPMPASSGGCPC